MTVKETMRMMQNRLAPTYGEGEAKAMSRLIFHSLKGWNMTDIIIHEPDDVSDYIQDKIKNILKRLDLHEPLQYILGEAHFYGMDLGVDKSTLIPRPETEELVDIIVKEWKNKRDLRVLDIGTGSGAIAIALARNLPFAEVAAIDISKEALSMAQANAKKMKADIHFTCKDVFDFNPTPETFEIIVSNPPYVDESEKAEMERNVVDYEPHSALFVPDNNPLIFYSRISDIAASALTKHGILYFEINPRHAADLRNLLIKDGFSEVEIHKDIHNRDRFISAIKDF